ncbi:CapA family protein [Streptomyces sp. UH6]|uniref:CapA family protein n=1 Tax=Streptomyces sp. UH6 TaxID=2748379 RepID=UPI0015D50661|nr:CapA family protein [Streptomyces sp. UH6]NYV72910.1 CapA family protein [Streptomyces sp. UH6]
MELEVGDVVVRPVAHEPLEGAFTLALVGDLIYLREASPTIVRRAPELVAALAAADLAFGNLETTLLDLETFTGAPQAESGGTWLHATPSIADDLRTLGFDLVSLANNHSSDWGAEGLTSTIESLDRAGLGHAGAGRTMRAARAPRYLELPNGRVALVAATSTFTSMAPAADPLGSVPGRPGVSALPVTPVPRVGEEAFAALRSIAGSMRSHWNRDLGETVMLLRTPFRKDPSLPPGGLGLDWRVDPSARTEVLRSVRQAHQNANFVIFSLHTHEPSNDSLDPAGFVPAFARDAIDAGANVVVCHGPHQLRGIEIYRDAPIFYSLGNFAMMSNTLEAVPRETYDSCAVDPHADVTPAEMMTARNRGAFGGAEMYESVLALPRFTDGRLVDLELLPLDLGTDQQGISRGVPHVAADDVAARIAERLHALSEGFGTDIHFSGGRLRATATDLA